MVIGAAVLLFIASFLDYYSFDCSGPICGKIDLPNLWSGKVFPALPSIVLAGLVAAALIVASRFQPEGRKALGLTLEQWGTALAVFATWTVLWTMFDGPLEHGDDSKLGVGIGRILALIANLLIAATALFAARVPALKAPLMGAPRPQVPSSPYGTGAHPGYGYPGPGAPYGGQPGQPGQPYGASQSDPAASGPTPAASAPAPAPAADFSPFWFAVPVNRPLFAEDGSPTPIAELAPGTWYLAVDQRGQALVAQTQDGRRGVLQDTSGIQRG
ncbi:membrane protein [Streptomyces caatingaensis]|uniref:Membrane protein n=1 Tax=Streptomyces caatingaensis TaxID=1678637 RepID=A0A0K9XHN4_9ACTN|nr:membrane protein [Streptomyces caatingaensis]